MRWPRIESLTSSVNDRLTGTRSLVNSVIGCGTPNKEDPHSHGFMSVKLNIASAPPALGYTTTDTGEPYLVARRDLAIASSASARHW